jgi:hypothetical protein
LAFHVYLSLTGITLLGRQAGSTDIRITSSTPNTLLPPPHLYTDPISRFHLSPWCVRPSIRCCGTRKYIAGFPLRTGSIQDKRRLTCRSACLHIWVTCSYLSAMIVLCGYRVKLFPSQVCRFDTEVDPIDPLTSIVFTLTRISLPTDPSSNTLICVRPPLSPLHHSLLVSTSYPLLILDPTRQQQQ